MTVLQEEYITCFDAISEAVHAVDPELKTMGPEQWPSPSNIEYYKHFMNGCAPRSTIAERI